MEIIKEYLNLAKKPVVLIICFVFISFFLHPKWMNFRLYFGNSEVPIPMNYVSNFYLWTKYNKNTYEKLIVGDMDKISYSNLRPRKTYILIHGFTRNGLESWIIEMKTALLWREDCNVISVDWEAGSLSAGYYVIKDRVPEVGEDVSKLITFLRSHTLLKGQEFHVIGHSLGAHVAGFIGKHLNGAIPRITGLDPAGLGYNGGTSDSRLDKTDAEFVDVIHTHGCYTILNQFTDCFGNYDILGHVDFWPNGGEYQPACDDDGDGKLRVREGSNCHHGMAYIYYTESIKFYKTSTRYLARECLSYEHFNNGSCECPIAPQYMGYNVNPKFHGVFYLNTSKTVPYGLLEPSCSSAEFSLIKVFGLLLCSQLVVFGLVYSSLVLASVWIKKDLVEIVKTKLSDSFPTLNGLEVNPKEK